MHVAAATSACNARLRPITRMSGVGSGVPSTLSVVSTTLQQMDVVESLLAAARSSAAVPASPVKSRWRARCRRPDIRARGVLSPREQGASRRKLSMQYCDPDQTKVVAVGELMEREYWRRRRECARARASGRAARASSMARAGQPLWL